MHVNETKELTIPPAEGYGPRDEAKVYHMSAPIIQSLAGKNFTVGDSMRNGDGTLGTVISVNATTLVVDFNPPLAGKTLVYLLTLRSLLRPR
jgi:FKBP-type peptidyl-prolyl cis-trans isomerase 2